MGLDCRFLGKRTQLVLLVRSDFSRFLNQGVRLCKRQRIELSFGYVHSVCNIGPGGESVTAFLVDPQWPLKCKTTDEIDVSGSGAPTSPRLGGVAVRKRWF
jgi:hypothetical protein